MQLLNLLILKILALDITHDSWNFTAFLTAIYSWRLFFKTFHGKYNNSDLPIEKTTSLHYNANTINFSCIRSFFAGYAFKELLIGHHYLDFWKNLFSLLKK